MKNAAVYIAAIVLSGAIFFLLDLLLFNAQGLSFFYRG